MWQPKIFYGMSYPTTYVFWQKIFFDAQELLHIKQIETEMWRQQDMFPDWQGRRNSAGMPVGREGPGSVVIPIGHQHSQHWQNTPTVVSIEHLSPPEQGMVNYCVGALTATGDVTYERAITLISDCVATGMTIENFYDLCRRGVDPAVATRMLHDFASESKGVQQGHAVLRVKPLAEVEADLEFEKQAERNRQKIAQVMGVSAQELGVIDDAKEASDQEELRQIFWNG